MSDSAAAKVLMIAYACHPEGVGEHWLGWGWAEQAAHRYQVHLLTTDRARAALEHYAARCGISVRFVPLPSWVRTWTEPLGRPGSWCRKVLWIYRAMRVAEAWHRQERFDLVHQTTFHTFRVPFLATRLGIPSVWGPVAGGEYIPFGFYKYLGPVLVPESLRRVFNLSWLMWPPVRRCLKRADVIFVSNRVTLGFLGPALAGKCIVVPPNAIRPQDECSPVERRDRAPDEPFRLLYVGNCLPTRAMGLAFAALVRSGMRDWEFTIIGGGSGLKFWQREARKYGVAERVRFLGQLPHAALAPHYERADAFVFPALRDSGGSALLEAMSKGVPVICLDWAGPSEIVDEDSGVKVPVTTPDETVQAFATALRRLHDQPDWRRRLGQNALQRARRLFTWRTKRELLEYTYEQLLAGRKIAPTRVRPSRAAWGEPEPPPRRLKVLLSAYACEPFKGSEPADGWNWALQMCRFHEVWVLTRANNRPSIERAQLTPEQQRIRWIYHDLPGWARFWKRGSRGIQLYYFLWQLSILPLVARLHRRLGFDLVHHVTFGKYWIPSYLPLLPLKSVVGPVGGGESTPPALAHTISRQGRWFEWKRDLARRLAEADPIIRCSYRRADVVLATTDETRVRLERLGARPVFVEPQFGLDDEQMAFFGQFPVRTEPPFRLISIGRLLHWKGFHLGLRAFARFSRDHPESEYWIVNDGPEASALKRLAAELGISRRVTFWGHLPTIGEVFDKLAQADVLVHPALHEAFGNVCLEALAAGRPVICLNTGGPALQVTEACGFKAPVSSLQACVEFLAEAMAQLYRNPALRRQMAQAARQRVRTDFHWTKKAERMNQFYHSICGSVA